MRIEKKGVAAFGRAPLPWKTGFSLAVLVLLIGVVQPGHHVAQFSAYLFQGMFRMLPAHSQKMGPAASAIF